MPKYRLTETAERDLIEIALYGYENFGVARCDQYRDRLQQRFETLAEFPELYPAVDYIREGYRRSVCGGHSIYYRVLDDGIEIVRVLGRQNPWDAF